MQDYPPVAKLERWIEEEKALQRAANEIWRAAYAEIDALGRELVSPPEHFPK